LFDIIATALKAVAINGGDKKALAETY